MEKELDLGVCFSLIEEYGFEYSEVVSAKIFVSLKETE